MWRRSRSVALVSFYLSFSLSPSLSLISFVCLSQFIPSQFIPPFQLRLLLVNIWHLVVVCFCFELNQVTHLHLALDADFAAQTLSGHADLSFEAVEACSQAILDTKALSIRAVTVADSGLALTFDLSANDPVFGQALNIQLGQTLAPGATLKVRIAYSTSATASAIQWLPPSQTSGKVHPYLFSQCQAIHCRSMAPVQDSPFNKFPYTADLTVPAPLVALMSAKRLNDGQPTPSADGLKSTYHFSQPVPMPSYLVALAAGALESRAIGPRSHVWSEKETVDAGAYEFAETESFLQAAVRACFKCVHTCVCVRE
jgi:leukotriene-A4 hydrolase